MKNKILLIVLLFALASRTAFAETAPGGGACSGGPPMASSCRNWNYQECVATPGCNANNPAGSSCTYSTMSVFYCFQPPGPRDAQRCCDNAGAGAIDACTTHTNISGCRGESASECGDVDGGTYGDPFSPGCMCYHQATNAVFPSLIDDYPFLTESTCSWSGNECEGTPTNCSAITMQIVCEEAGCSWESGITGFTVGIAPDPAQRNDVITATSSATATGGQDVYFQYNWTVATVFKTLDGNNVGDDTNPPATESNFPCATYGCSVGDRVSVEVTAWFTNASGTFRTTQPRSVMIQPSANQPPNTPPKMALSPTYVYSDGTVNCVNCPPVVTDPDGNAVTLSYQWYLNHAVQAAYSPATTFNCPGTCAIGNTIEATIKACDDQVPSLCSESPYSDPVTVVDRAAPPQPTYMALAIVVAFLILSVAYMATYIFEMM